MDRNSYLIGYMRKIADNNVTSDVSSVKSGSIAIPAQSIKPIVTSTDNIARMKKPKVSPASSGTDVVGPGDHVQ